MDSVSEQEFLKKLEAMGIRKSKLSDLLGPNDYDSALPVILEHIPLIKGTTERDTLGYRETLIRSLGVPAAKKLPDVWPKLMEIFLASDDYLVKWAIGQTLVQIVKKPQLPEVMSVLSSPRHEGAREPFCRMARNLGSESLVPVLLALLSEPRVKGKYPEFPYNVKLSPADPIIALGYLGGKEIIPQIEPFLADCFPGTQTPDTHVREQAKKAIDRILKRSSS